MSSGIYKGFRNAIKSHNKGEKIVNIIQKNNSGKRLLFFPHKSLGDIYILGLYEKVQSVVYEEDYVLVVVGNACKKVATNVGFLNVVALSEDAMKQCITYITYEGEDKVKCKILHFLFYHTSIFYKIIDYKKYNFIECYRKFVFQKSLDNISGCNYKKISEEYLIKYPVIKNRTIVIAPYAKSVTNFSPEFWLNLVMILRNQGYKRIYTNCAGDERPIIGTKKLEIPFEEMIAYLDIAGIFIGIRSGLCDLISQSRCKKIILYPEKSFIKNSKEYYSLNLLPNTRNFREYEIQDECMPYDDIIKYIYGENV